MNMKLPKKTKRYCPFCKKRTDQKVDVVSTGSKRGTLKRGALGRAKLRGANRGMGNQGKYSRKAIKSWKRKTKTTTRKVIIYKCTECSKSKHTKNSRRVSKLMIE
ncbi:50S ribosomal protein L44e [archaeon]|nr:50S ribosomal protein L44e [archaeon]